MWLVSCCTACPTASVYDSCSVLMRLSKICILALWVKSYSTLLDSPLPQVSLKCRAPEVSQCVFQSYEAMLKNWEAPLHWPSRYPRWLACSRSPDPRTISHLHAVQEPLPAVLAEAALCVSFSCLIRMVNDSPPPQTADCRHFCFAVFLLFVCLSRHNFQFQGIISWYIFWMNAVTLSRSSTRPCRGSFF